MDTGTLDLYPLRFRSVSPRRVWTANTLRGAFGSALKQLDERIYARFFTPSAHSLPSSAAGKAPPSGLRDLPRPFVFRLREGEIRMHLFLPSALDLVCRVMARLDLELAAPAEILRLSFPAPDLAVSDEAAASSVQRLRVHFLTPTELKGASEPDFGVLLARVRDRISTLRALYGPGPLPLDFRAFGERARHVRMTRCQIETVTQERLSKRTGQRHSLGGFVGFAEYEGPVAEFLPYLEAARWTGVGRQTVWGKGEIRAEILHD